MADKPVTPATDAPAEINWDDFTFPEVEVINRERQLVTVPAGIVTLAQASLDAKERHQMIFRPELGGIVAADKFAKLMAAAGDHTKPLSSVSVVQDGIIVKYRAGERRGRKVSKS